MVQKKNRLFAWVCGLYVLPVVIAILFARLSEIQTFDLSLTVSLYVARYSWTAVLFFVHILVVCLLFFQYIKKIKIKRIQKILYLLVIACILGCAWFPCNRSRSVICSDIHDIFSYLLVIAVALTFMTMLFCGSQKKQRIFAAGGLLYATVFILSFVFRIPMVKQSIFIWENIFILLLFTELYLEMYYETSVV